MALTKVTGQVIKNTTDVTVGVLTVTNTLAVGGTVSIGGTLTYEDVTNVDAVGLITARNGIVVGSGITLSKDGDVFFTGIATGNGSGLTAINASTVTVADVSSDTSCFVLYTTAATGDLQPKSGSNLTFNSSNGTLTATSFSGSTGTFTGDVDIADKIVHTGDTNTAIRFPSSDTFSVETSGTEALRVDSSQRLVLGATSQRTVWGGQQKLSIEGLDGPTSSLSIVRNSNDAFYPFIALGKSRGTSDGSSTVIQENDVTGIISFNAADGTDMNNQTAYIESAVDDSPGSNDTPGRLSFYTTGDGSGTSTERVRITSAGEVQIATTSGNEKLNVAGAIRSSGSSVNFNGGLEGAIVDYDTSNNLARFGHVNGASGSARDVLFLTGGSEKVRMTSSGQFLIGSSSHFQVAGHNSNFLLTGATYNEHTGAIVANENTARGAMLQFEKQRSGAVGGTTIIQDGDNVGHMRFVACDGVDLNSRVAEIAAQVDGTPGSNDTPGRLIFSTTPDGSDSSVERLRIDNAGAIRFGATAAIQAEKFTFFRQESDANTLAYFHQGASADVTGLIMRHGRGLSGFNGKIIGFLRNDGTEVGYISIGNGTVTYNTGSDYRLKENEVAISDGITRLKTLKPYKFNFKNDPDYKFDGFFAHEVSTAVPEAVQGEKDAIDDNGDPKYQSIDHSRLVPLLTAALQEAIVKIETLESEVAALKSS